MRALAEVAGVAFSAVTETELNKRRPRTDTTERLAVALKVTRRWLSYGDGLAPDGYQASGAIAGSDESGLLKG